MAPNNTTGSIEESKEPKDAAPENKENAEPDGVVATPAGSATPSAVKPAASGDQSAAPVVAPAPPAQAPQTQNGAAQPKNSDPNAPAPHNGTAPQNAPQSAQQRPAPAQRPAAAPPNAGAQNAAQRPAPRPVVKCAKCARDNTPDSKFCRHCGTALVRPVAAAHPAQAQKQAVQQKTQAAAPQANGAAQPRPAQQPAQQRPVQPQPNANGQAAPPPQQRAPQAAPQAQAAAHQAARKPGEGSLTPREIDERRARQLLDRALHLAEQKDLHGAVVACRQAIALAPVLPAAYSMLGLLLERGGNAKGAIVAYEKTLQLAPNSPVERESLMRLRAAQSQNAPVFHFDDNDLFADAVPPEDDSADNAAPDASPQDVSTQAAPAVSPVAPVAATSAVVATAVAANAAGAPNVQPVAMPVKTAPPSAAAALATTSGGLQMPPQVSPNDLPSSPPTLWRAVKERPSFFMRTLPLLAVMPASLLFLLWARNMADSRNAPQVTEVQQNIAGQTTGTAVVPDNTTTQTANAGSPDGGNTSTTTTASNSTNVSPGSERGAIPITNDWRPTPSALAAPPAPGNTTANASAGTSSPRTTSSAPAARPPRAAARPVPSIPSPRTDTAGRDTPRRDTPARNDAQPNNEPFAIPPARVLSGPPAEEPIRVNSNLPGAGNSGADSGASTSGGGPVGNGGRRGSIRVITRPQAQPAIPDPSTTDSPAIRPAPAAPPAASTTAYDRAARLQQRALILLERGDSTGAITDFRTAINLYNEQIATGTRVAESRNGIASCRSGIQLAQSNR